MNNLNSQDGSMPRSLPGGASLSFIHESNAEKRPRIQHPNDMYHNFISTPLIMPAVFNPSNGTYSFISNIPGALPLRADYADSSEDGSNSESQSRSNYMCRKCNKPKKGHICTMQQQSIIRRATADPPIAMGALPCSTSSSSSSSSSSLSSSQVTAQTSTESPHSSDAAVQVEIDTNMTVRGLGDLSVQGLTGSYESMSAAAIAERRAQHDEAQKSQPLGQTGQNSFSF